MTKPRVKLSSTKRTRRTAKPSKSIIDTMLDPNLFGPWFKHVEEWENWITFLKGTFAVPMSKEQKEIYKNFTKRDTLPKKQFEESWIVVGRRGGKSLILALIAVYLACFVNWKPNLAPGERATIMVVAADRKQARVIFRYIEAFLKQVPMLDGLIERETAEIFELKGQVVIEIHTASFRSIRGYTIAAALLDELAFWRSEDSHNPDSEILNAIRPGSATMPGSMILCASSPYARRGELYKNWKKYYGRDEDRILVWQAPTWDMNPTVPQNVYDDAYAADPASAAAEYGANFRTDVESFVPEEVVDACTDTEIFERPRLDDYEYFGFTDPSGGSKDSFTLAIAHMEDNVPTVDLLKEHRPPFSPDDVVSDYADTLREYNVSIVSGDRYGGEWPVERFSEHDIIYKTCQKTKSQLYGELLPLLNSKQVRLLDNAKGKTQLVSLERRTSRGGRDSIDHPPGGHDDVANVIAGVVAEVKGITPLDLW